MSTAKPRIAEREPINVVVEKLVYGGDGLARVDGQVLLAPFVLPGETVRVQPGSTKGGVLRGRTVEVLEPSPQRVKPGCSYFGRCGGCHYQHASYEFQLEQKQAILRETLRRVGRISWDGEIGILSGEPWDYRNRVQLHFDGREVGYQRAGSHTLQPIDHCPISSPLIKQAIEKISWAVKQSQWPEFVRTLEMFSNEQQIQLTVQDSTRPVAARFFTWCGTFLPLAGPGPLPYEAAGHTFGIGPGSFFQVNRFLVDVLVDEVIGSREGNSALDLYAGVGLFSLPLAKRFGRVQAVERGRSAFNDLVRNSAEAENVHPEHAESEAFLQSTTEPPDLVIADPPRAGLDKAMTTEILRLRPRDFVLVSCDPATLSRDLATLVEGFEIARLTLVDLFPQTYHFETVVHLKRK
jgi:23S rRNA (uracil1939-C5)-methyltransferase